MKKILFLLLIVGSMVLISSCKKTLEHEPMLKSDAVPATVTNIKVKNIEGGAIITYTVPSDPELLYVEAEYNINDKAKRQAKTSFCADTIMVSGFAKAGEYKINLYSVSRSEVKSNPIVVTVNPLEPAYRSVFQSLSMNNDFGGVCINFKNPLSADIAIVVISPDKLGDMSYIDTYYTNSKDGQFKVRGYDPVKRVFGAYVRDRWGNISDTLYTEITPFFETLLDKTKFREVVLPTDVATGYGWVMTRMWDNIVGDQGYHTVTATVGPVYFTFDLGVQYKLSRFKMWQRKGYEFVNANPKEFELWGSNSPSLDGSWTGWTKILRGSIIKPSGSGDGIKTAADIAAAGEGNEFSFPSPAPSYRYIRYVSLENWIHTSLNVHISEVTFWGSPN